MLPDPALGLDELVALDGGVVSPGIWRCRRGDEQLVFKRCQPTEVRVMQLIDQLDEPLFPTLIDHGTDQHGPWLLTAFFDGEPLGLTGVPPVEVQAAMGRLHAGFVGAAGLDWLPRWDGAKVAWSLDSFARTTVEKAAEVLGQELTSQVLAMVDELAADHDFLTEGERGRQTLLHADLYGMNVLRRTDSPQSLLVIDWGNAAVGPPMLDVGMSADWDSPQRLAHTAGWLAADGPELDDLTAEREHRWAHTLCHTIFCGDLALRSGRGLVEQLLPIARSSYRRYRELAEALDVG